VSQRELLVLGTAAQVPTRHRNHNGYLLRWDREALLFDPGEGTQRQMLLAGAPAGQITRILVSHFHGDHCLGLPGVIQRINLDRPPHGYAAYYPASGQHFFERLRGAAAFHETVAADLHPVAGDAADLPAPGAPFTLRAERLSHPVESYGYRLEEPDGRRILPDRLAARGITGPDIGRLQREGRVTAPDGGTVALDEVSVPRPGQSFAFLMDTRLCQGAARLAEGVDMLVAEATFLEAEADLAEAYGHLTARQAARLAAEAGARHLVLTHFSQRYQDTEGHLAEARECFDGEISLAADLDRIPLPARRAAPLGEPAGKTAGGS
jgi:ribonuclease Z